MSETKIKPCPVCGKMPKVKRDYSYESSGFGAWCTIQCKPLFRNPVISQYLGGTNRCTIQCKPLFRNPHLKIEEGKATWDRAHKYAIVHWNEAVEEMEEREQ